VSTVYIQPLKMNLGYQKFKAALILIPLIIFFAYLCVGKYYIPLEHILSFSFPEPFEYTIFLMQGCLGQLRRQSSGHVWGYAERLSRQR